MNSSERSVINYRGKILPHRATKSHNAGIHVPRIMPFLFIVLLSQPQLGIGATTGRFWTYLSLTSLHSPNWAVVAMPGLRYEFARNDDPPGQSTKGLYFYEFLFGPVFTKATGAFTLKLPIWYYYMGFPTPDAYFYSHNIEFLPILTYRFNKVTLTSRTIFHNTLYASVYETSDLCNGYSLVVRQLFQVSYDVSPRASVVLADEPFFGVIEDKEAPPSSIGFWPTGFRLNRLYLGLAYKIAPQIVISPQYVLETVHDGRSLTDTNHYLFVTVSCVLKFF
jgi:hypothetical protein